MEVKTARGAKTALTKEQLDTILKYDPEEGHFTRLKSAGGMVAGSTAGYVHKHVGYVEIRVNGKAYYAHRLANLTMTGEWPSAQMDHINHVKTDNRWTNLRAASASDNTHNQRGWSSSGYKCITTYDTAAFGTRYAVKIKRGDTRYQEVFSTLESAIEYRDAVITRHDGAFANTSHRDD